MLEPSNVPAYWRQKGLSIRAANALANNGIRDLADLKKMTCNDLLRFPNFGDVSLCEVQTLTGWPKDNAPKLRQRHETIELVVALKRANKLILWMSYYIGNMAPGNYAACYHDLNEHGLFMDRLEERRL